MNGQDERPVGEPLPLKDQVVHIRQTKTPPSGVCVLAEVHELFRALLAIFRPFIAIAHQFESENAASRVDVDPVPVGKQTSTLRADTPIDPVANDLTSV